MKGIELALGEASLERAEDHETWSVKVAVAELAAFGGQHSSPWVDYEQLQPLEITAHLVVSCEAELDEEFDSEEEAYEDGAREYSLWAFFETKRAAMAEHPYADEQFLASVYRALSEAGLPAEPEDVEFSEQGAQSPEFAHLELSYEYAAKVRARFS